MHPFFPPLCLKYFPSFFLSSLSFTSSVVIYSFLKFSKESYYPSSVKSFTETLSRLESNSKSDVSLQNVSQFHSSWGLMVWYYSYNCKLNCCNWRQKWWCNEQLL
jgi:hypothetical protein